MANTLKFKRGLVAGIPTAALGEPLFTTDTFDLYIGNGTGNTRFQKYIASGATTQILRGDGSLYTFPLAISSPTNGQVLKYNGTSWVNDSDAGITGSGAAGQVAYFTGATTQAGTNNLFWDATNGRLGIGTNSPSERLTIGGRINFGSFSTDVNDYSFYVTTGGNGGTTISSAGATSIIFRNNSAESARINGSNRLIVGGGTTDLGQKLQVVGTGYFSDSVGIGSTTLTGYNLRISNNITGIVSPIPVLVDGAIQATATGATQVFRSSPSVVAGASISEIRHFSALQGTIGASATIGGQTGFFVHSSMTGATNNWAFYGDLAAATGRWNLYMNGTALNYLNGSLLIGSTTDSGEKLQVTGTMKVTGASSFGGQIISTLANNTAIGGGQIYLNGATGNRIDWVAAGVGDPTVTTRSVGTKLVLYPSVNASEVDFGLGISSNTLWFSVPNNFISSFKWFGSTTRLMELTAGNLGLGVTPSSWAASRSKIEFSSAGTTAGFVGCFAGSSANNQMGLGSNAYYNASSVWTYSNTGGGAGYYAVKNNVHEWHIAPSGTAGNAITFTQAMTLDASGNLQIGQTTDAYNAANRVVVGINGATDSLISMRGGGTSFGYIYASSAALDINANSRPLTFSTTGVEKARILNNGNFHIGTFTADSGEKLQVTGTMKVTGNVTVGTTTTASFGKYISITDTLSAATTYANASQKYTTGVNSVNEYGIYNETSSAYHLRISSTGAATFSSSVTAASGIITGNLTVDTNTLFVDATNNYVGIGTVQPKRNLDISTTGTPELVLGALSGGTDQKYWRMYAASDILRIGNVNDAFSSGTDVIQINRSNNVGLGMTPSYKLDVTGSARVSDAIAIGTTPDTNNPFKILKNINATVGIKFENTNTSSLAFSAVQLGTDVSGGTKFTNLVYASSGVTASGVYNPDGTSLINNGNGGLNFLGNPIRMYTGGSNGVLRWDISNEGIIQYNATSPTTSATDAYKQYSADVTAGNAAPHFRTENGAVIKLYQETTAVGNAIFSQGGGNAVLDDSTFAGYTIRQVVQALRNQGILQ